MSSDLNENNKLLFNSADENETSNDEQETVDDEDWDDDGLNDDIIIRKIPDDDIFTKEDSDD